MPAVWMAARAQLARAPGRALAGTQLAPFAPARACSSAAEEDSAIITIASDQEFETHVQEDELVIGYFTASWCGPCRMMKPYVEEVAKRHKDSISFLKVDIDEHERLAGRSGIQAVPTFMFWIRGERVGEIRGANPQGLSAAADALASGQVGGERAQ